MARQIIELMDDMHLSSQSTFLDYYYAMQANNVSDANSILANNPSVANQITNSENINEIIDRIIVHKQSDKQIKLDIFIKTGESVYTTSDNLGKKFHLLDPVTTSKGSKCSN